MNNISLCGWTTFSSPLHPLRSFCTVDLGLPPGSCPSGALPFMPSPPIRAARGPQACLSLHRETGQVRPLCPLLPGRLPLWVIHRPCSAHYPSPQGTITPRCDHHTTLSPLVLPHGAPSRMSGPHVWKRDSGKGHAHPREPISSSRSGWASLGGPWLCPGDPDPRDASHPTPLSSSKSSVGASMTLTSSPAKQGLNPAPDDYQAFRVPLLRTPVPPHPSSADLG